MILKLEMLTSFLFWFAHRYVLIQPYNRQYYSAY